MQGLFKERHAVWNEDVRDNDQTALACIWYCRISAWRSYRGAWKASYSGLRATPSDLAKAIAQIQGPGHSERDRLALA